MSQESEWLNVWETFATESETQFILELKATDIAICFFSLNSTYFTVYFLMQTVWEVALLLCFIFVFFDNIIMSIASTLGLAEVFQKYISKVSRIMILLKCISIMIHFDKCIKYQHHDTIWTKYQYQYHDTIYKYHTQHWPLGGYSLIDPVRSLCC